MNGLQSIHRTQCDLCTRTGPETSDVTEVWRLATAEGWYCDARVTRCPEHWPGYSIKEERKRVTAHEPTFDDFIKGCVADCVEGAPTVTYRHTTTETGDCVAWCRACLHERNERLRAKEDGDE